MTQYSTTTLTPTPTPIQQQFTIKTTTTENTNNKTTSRSEAGAAPGMRSQGTDIETYGSYSKCFHWIICEIIILAQAEKLGLISNQFVRRWIPTLFTKSADVETCNSIGLFARNFGINAVGLFSRLPWKLTWNRPIIFISLSVLFSQEDRILWMTVLK